MMDTEHTEIDQVGSFDSHEEEIKENCALFLGDLSIYCDEKDIEEAFAPYGNIVDVRIQRSKETSRALSYGFIEFSCQDSAAAALSEMNYFLLKGRPLRIRWAASRNNPIKSAATPHDSAATVYVRFLTQAADVVVSEESLRNIFNNYGPVFDCAIKKLSHDQKCNRTKGYAFVSFDSGVLIQGGVDVAGVDAAYRACNDLRNRVVGNVRYRCEFGNRLQKQYGPAVQQVVPQMLPQPACYVTEMPMQLPPPITTAYAQPPFTGAINAVSPLAYAVPHNTPVSATGFQVQRPVQAQNHQQPPAAQQMYAQNGYGYQPYAVPTYAANSVDTMNGSPSHYLQQQQMQQVQQVPQRMAQHPPAPAQQVSSPQMSVKQHNGYASAPASASTYPAPLTSSAVMQQTHQQHHQQQMQSHHHNHQQNLQSAYQCQIQAQAQAQALMQAQAQAQAQAQQQAQQAQGYAYSQYQQQTPHGQYQYYPGTPRMYASASNSNGGTPTHASTVHTVTPTSYGNANGMMMQMPVMMVPVHMPLTSGGQMVYQQMSHSQDRPYQQQQQQQQVLPPQTFMQASGKNFIGSAPQGSCSDYFAERGINLSISTQSFEELHGVPGIGSGTHSQGQGQGQGSRDTTPRSLYTQRTKSTPTSRRSNQGGPHGYQAQVPGHGQYNHSLMSEMRKPASRRGSNDSVGTINMFLGCASNDDAGERGGNVSTANMSLSNSNICVSTEPVDTTDVVTPETVVV